MPQQIDSGRLLKFLLVVSPLRQSLAMLAQSPQQDGLIAPLRSRIQTVPGEAISKPKQSSYWVERSTSLNPVVRQIRNSSENLGQFLTSVQGNEILSPTGFGAR